MWRCSELYLKDSLTAETQPPAVQADRQRYEPEVFSLTALSQADWRACRLESVHDSVTRGRSLRGNTADPAFYASPVIGSL